MDSKTPRPSKSAQIASIAGALLIIFGVFKLFDQFFGASWWGIVERIVTTFISFVWPISLIVIGGYLIWAGSTGKFKGVTFDSSRPLRRSIYDKRIAGVCGGVARYFNIDSMIVRVIALVLLVMVPGFTLLVYVIAAVLMPKA